MLTVSFDALASYRDGAAGVFFLMFSIPVAMLGFALTLTLAARGYFRVSGRLFPHFLFWAAIWLGVVIFTSMQSFNQSDPDSLPIVVIGEGVLVLTILLPAFIQSYRRTRAAKSDAPGEPPDTV